MASDLKIEIFACYVVNSYWRDDTDDIESDVLAIYGDECARDSSYLEACDDLFVTAILQTREITEVLIAPYITKNIIKGFTSLSEVYDYIVYMCDRDDFFGNLNVFDRMFATFDFVIHICAFTYLENKSIRQYRDIDKFCYSIWAMYFDKFTEEFYREGGWSQLRRVAKSYGLLNNFFFLFFPGIEISFRSVKESVINYCQFRKELQYQEYKNFKRHHKICVSTEWIKFRIKHFDSYINIPFVYENVMSPSEAYILLDDLRFLCYPDLKNNIYRCKELQEGYQEYCLHQRKHIFQHNIYRIFGEEFIETFYGCDSAKEFIINNCLISEKEVRIFDIGVNRRWDNWIRTKMEMPQYNMSIIEMTKYKQEPLLDSIMSMVIDAMQKSTNIVNGTSKSTPCAPSELEELHSIAESFSTKRKESGYISKKSKGIHCKSYDLSVNESGGCRQEIEDSTAILESNINSENKSRSETAWTTKNEALSQMAASKLNGKNSDILPNSKQSSPVNHNTDLSDEIERPQKPRDVLRNEQDDPEIQKFLRLILLLGDKQRLKSLFVPLSSNKESSSNLLEKSKKKRSKNKKLQK